MTPTIVALENPIQGYAWGSTTAIASFLGRDNPDRLPQAELWIGAHPKAPSRVVGGSSLAELIRGAPEAMLGPQVAATYAGELPFLLKVIAAAEPLSIQCHPNREQARAGFEREERLGIPRTAFERNYRDPNHKPELVVGLTRFIALKGFRPLEDMLRLLRPLGLSGPGEALEPLEGEGSPERLRDAFSRLFSLEGGTRSRRVRRAAADARRLKDADPAYRWLVQLDLKYPGDVGALGPLLLNLVELAPGDGLFLPAGELHAHLEGTALELMANSDNVLRGGLTPKHVDAGELLATLSFRCGAPEVLRPLAISRCEVGYETPAREFELRLIAVAAGAAYAAPAEHGVELLLGLEGEATLTAAGRSLSLAKGRSAFVPAAVADYRIEGEGRVCRAGVPRL